MRWYSLRFLAIRVAEIGAIPGQFEAFETTSPLFFPNKDVF